MRLKTKCRPATPCLEVIETRPLLSTLVALVDYGVDLNNSNDSRYYDLADAFNAYTGQLASQAGDGVVQYTPCRTARPLPTRRSGIADVSAQPGVNDPDIKTC